MKEKKEKKIIDINKWNWGWCIYWDSAIKIAEYRHKIEGESPKLNIDFEVLINKTEKRFLSLRGIIPFCGVYTPPDLGERMKKMLDKSIEEAALKILNGEVKFTY